MQSGVFNGLSSQLKTSYVVELLQSFDKISSVGGVIAVGCPVDDQDEIFTSKAALASFELDPATIVSIIETLVQPLESATQKKKAKHDERSVSRHASGGRLPDF